jgi:hypothetical protein
MALSNAWHGAKSVATDAAEGGGLDQQCSSAGGNSTYRDRSEIFGPHGDGPSSSLPDNRID